MSADPNIADVSIANPQDGVVKIVPIMLGGLLPSQEVLDKIVVTCSDAKVRPMTDIVIAAEPISEPFSVDVVYYVDAASEAATVANVEADGGAVERYIQWQITKLGRDINPDQLRKEILGAGAMRVDVIEPAFKQLDVYTVAQWSGSITVSHQVTEE